MEHRIRSAQPADRTDQIRVVAAVIEREGKLLVCQRPPHKRHGGLWEFPGGKTEPGEDDLAAVSRELREELDVDVVSVAGEVFRIQDHGSEFVIAFIPTTIAGEPRALEHDSIAWAEIDELQEFELAPSDALFVSSRLRASDKT
jgi:8-oxo-dGTP diphosphatase